MPSKLKKLKKRYGKLTVNTPSYLDGGRRYVDVTCTCGATKPVLVQSLLAGNAKSCGAPLCKITKRVTRDPEFRPRPPRAITVRRLCAAWAAYHHEDPAKRRTMAELAEKYDVNLTTLITAFNAIRKAGGIAAYEKALQG